MSFNTPAILQRALRAPPPMPQVTPQKGDFYHARTLLELLQRHNTRYEPIYSQPVHRERGYRLHDGESLVDSHELGELFACGSH